jgi:hypothetical protein
MSTAKAAEMMILRVEWSGKRYHHKRAPNQRETAG